MSDDVRHSVLGQWMRPFTVALLLATGCGAPNAIDAEALEPLGDPALERLPPEQQALTERLLREGPRVARIKNNPPIYIDGKRVTEPEPTGKYSVINPDLIHTAEFLPPREAGQRIGAEGRNGVFWITTKAAVAAKP